MAAAKPKAKAKAKAVPASKLGSSGLRAQRIHVMFEKVVMLKNRKEAAAKKVAQSRVVLQRVTKMLTVAMRRYQRFTGGSKYASPQAIRAIRKKQNLLISEVLTDLKKRIPDSNSSGENSGESSDSSGENSGSD